jgi:hypothetical protein
VNIRLGNYDKAEACLTQALTHEEKMTAKMKDVINKLKQEIKNH